MSKTVRRAPIYLEDLATGTGTASRGTSSGGTQTLTKISLSLFGLAVTSVSSGPYSAAISDGVILVTGTFTIDLPTAIGNTGRYLVIKNIGTGTITVDASGTQTIDGALTYTLTLQYEVVTIVSDGSNWHIIA